MRKIITKPYFLLMLFCINLTGSIYGFYWYRQQISDTPSILKVFVPDSPTASLLFTLAILMILIKKPRPFVIMMACAWLIKYGLWAVIINTHYFFIGGDYTFTNFHLTLSHLGMALEGFIFINEVNVINKSYILTLTVLMIISDAVDYTLGIHPWLFAQSQWNIACVSIILLTLFVSLYFFLLYKNRCYQL